MSGLDETARLVLMEMESERTDSLLEFARRLRDAEASEVSAVQVGQLWAKYMGYDGRSLPTHNLYTGERY